MAGYPAHPSHPERVCWGCDKYCPATDLTCGKDTVRTLHPLELFGHDWDSHEPAEAEALQHAPTERA